MSVLLSTGDGCWAVIFWSRLWDARGTPRRLHRGAARGVREQRGLYPKLLGRQPNHEFAGSPGRLDSPREPLRHHPEPPVHRMEPGSRLKGHVHSYTANVLDTSTTLEDQESLVRLGKGVGPYQGTTEENIEVVHLRAMHSHASFHFPVSGVSVYAVQHALRNIAP